MHVSTSTFVFFLIGQPHFWSGGGCSGIVDGVTCTENECFFRPFCNVYWYACVWCHLEPVKGVIIYYNFRSDPKLSQGVVSVRITSWSCQSCTIQLSLPWDNKTEVAFNQPRYGRFYYCNYSLILVPCNNCIIVRVFMRGHIPCNPKIKVACNYPRYGRVYYFKYSLIIGFHNNCIIMVFLWWNRWSLVWTQQWKYTWCLW